MTAQLGYRATHVTTEPLICGMPACDDECRCWTINFTGIHGCVASLRVCARGSVPWPVEIVFLVNRE